MTNTAPQIATRLVNGIPALIGPEALVRPALNGGELTINRGKFAGDRVQLGTAYAPEPGTGVGWAQRAVLEQFEHPQHGVILVAPINMRVLDNAPALAAWESHLTAETTAAEKRIAAEDARLGQLDRDI